MRTSSLWVLVGLASAGCSSANFAVGAEDGGGGGADTAVAADTGGGDTGAIGPDTGGLTDSGDRADTTAPPPDSTPGGDSALDTGPIDAGCPAVLPVTACASPPSGPYENQFTFTGYTALTPRINSEVAHAISYVTAKAGRHEKMILTLRRHVADPSGVVGSVTLEAFVMPCPGVLVPLGKSRTLPVNEGGEQYSFYFREAEGNALPTFPAGTRMAFRITHDSTKYQLELPGSAPTGGTSAPGGLQWWTKKADAPWTLETSLPSASPWVHACG